jgi:hypothetical protein
MFVINPSPRLLPEGGMMDLFLERDAVISNCRQYRYLLRRTRDAVKPRARYVMLNPSTADADIDDATIRSCIRLAKGLGYGSFEVVNLFASRRPTLLIWQLPPSRQASTITDRSNGQMARCDIAICAGGAHPMAERRASTVLRDDPVSGRPPSGAASGEKEDATASRIRSLG